ncbi:MAG: hypothetical protein RIQ53_737 [Pseudomonadota bacterium]|jgi:3',5'-cyclic AMP phosphodiesterase CpdA
MSVTLLAQLSDLHIVPAGERLDGRIDTAAGLRAAVATVAGWPQAPDAVVLTGDLTDTGAPAAYAHLQQLLAPLAGVPLWPVAGNHDDRLCLREAWLADAAPALAAALAGEAPPHRPDGPLDGHDLGCPPGRVEGRDDGPGSAADGFLQYTVPVGTAGLRLVVLDTAEAGQPWGRLCPRRLAWLDRTLARHRDASVIVALHHPPFDSGIAVMDRIGLREGREGLAEVLAAHPQVERVICGHLHRNVHASIGRVPVSCAPSPAHQIALQMDPQAPGGWILEPPGLHLHRWTGPGQLVTHLVPVGRFDGPHPFGR